LSGFRLLPRQHAAHGHAELQDLGPEGLSRRELARLVRLVEDEGMEMPSPAWKALATLRP
jgi:hypothetical protein